MCNLKGREKLGYFKIGGVVNLFFRVLKVVVCFLFYFYLVDCCCLFLSFLFVVIIFIRGWVILEKFWINFL